MKILFCELFESLTSKTLKRYIEKLGHRCTMKTYYTPDDLYGDERIDNMIKKDIKLIHPDVVMTVNFWPPVARSCKKSNIKYISYSYDSPQNIPTLDDMEYETNYIFLFDRAETEEYRKRGITRAFHAPLATDIDTWDKKAPDIKVSYDVSLVGSVYKSTFPALLAGMDEYLRGYFKALIAAQQKIYGYYLINELIENKMEEVNSCYRKRDSNGADVSVKQMSYSMGSYINYLDRVSLMRLIKVSGMDIHFFTGNISEEDKKLLEGITIHGKVGYEDEMPVIFKSSMINLNPTSRVIRTGVPQRVLDVLGCKAFLLSSYQPETDEYFIQGEELVMYDSYEDAVAKARCYLEHDDIRMQIANSGYEKIKRFFTYEQRLTEMFEIAGMM